jgi:hypothetical protein
MCSAACSEWSPASQRPLLVPAQELPQGPERERELALVQQREQAPVPLLVQAQALVQVLQPALVQERALRQAPVRVRVRVRVPVRAPVPVLVRAPPQAQELQQRVQRSASSTERGSAAA